VAEIFVDSGACIAWIEKTGQVLVRIRPRAGMRKAQ